MYQHLQIQRSGTSPGRNFFQTRTACSVPNAGELAQADSDDKNFDDKTVSESRVYQTFSQVPLDEPTRILQRAERTRPVRSASGGGRVQSVSDEKVECYGVAQGHFASVKRGIKVGTSSLGSCFVVISPMGTEVLFAHVHACSEAVLQTFSQSLDLKKTKIIKGSAPSESTDQLIKILMDGGATVVGSTGTGAVVYDGLAITKPSDISPTNDDYREKNAKGQTMGFDENLKSMES